MALENMAHEVKKKLNQLDLNKPEPHPEGRMTRMVENQTAKVPSITYLNLAVGSMLISAGLVIFSNRKEFANFVGLWAPSFMLMGIYNKLVKLEGSDHSSLSSSSPRSASA